MINFRHLVYGLVQAGEVPWNGRPEVLYDLLPDRRDLCPAQLRPRAPPGVEEHDYYFAVSMLDHSYWILGSVLGSVLGSALGVDTTGVDFAMTALFLVIAVGQWKKAGSTSPPCWEARPLSSA